MPERPLNANEPEYPFVDDSAFASATVSDLSSADDRTSDAAKEPFDYATEKQRAKIDKARAENKMRKRFFKWASRVAGWIVGLNFGVFAAYLAIQAFAPGKIPDPVMYYWITATVVEILGIMAIIARHLFPGRRWQAAGPSVNPPRKAP